MSLLFILTIFMTGVQSDISIYDYSIDALNSDESISLEQYKGKKILFVNVASKCGFTGQYAKLEELYEENKEKLVVIGFPCNQFLFQEPSSEEKIAQFCQKNYGVTFPMTQKIKVKGKDAHGIYKWLTKKELNGVMDSKVSWNFNKFLIDENGKLLAHFPAKTSPMDERILSML